MEAAFPPTRSAARAARARSSRVAGMQPKARKAPSPPPINQEAPLFRLGLLLEPITLLLNIEEARAFRATCQTVRDLTLEPGFGTLWRRAHRLDERARLELERMRGLFSMLDEQVELEAETQPEPGSDWTRVLPPRSSTAFGAGSSNDPMPSSSPPPHEVEALCDRAAAAESTKKAPSPPPASGAAASPELLQHWQYFSAVDAVALESEVVGAREGGASPFDS